MRTSRIMQAAVGVVLILSTGHITGPGFVKTKVTDKIVMLLPAEFLPMTEQDRSEKIETPRSAMALYTNLDRRVDFGINQSTNPWSASDFFLMKDFYKSSLMSLFSEIDFLQESVETINGREFAVFEFISVIRDQGSSSPTGRAIRKYNYIQYTLVDSKALIFSFSAPASDQNVWSGKARTFMSSVKIK